MSLMPLRKGHEKEIKCRNCKWFEFVGSDYMKYFYGDSVFVRNGFCRLNKNSYPVNKDFMFCESFEKTDKNGLE